MKDERISFEEFVAALQKAEVSILFFCKFISYVCNEKKQGDKGQLRTVWGRYLGTKIFPWAHEYEQDEKVKRFK